MIRYSLAPAFVLTILLQGAAWAGPTTYGAAVRDWKAPGVALKVRLAFDLPDARAAKPISSPAARRTTDDGGGWLPGDLVVQVAITLDGPSALRVGECEKFVVQGEYQSLGNLPSGQNRIRLRLMPSGVVFAYQDLEGPISFERVVPVYGTSGSYDASFRLTSRGRLVTTPPNTISEVVLDGPPDGNSLKIRWKDAGNPESIPTGYAYEVWEKRWWWRDVLIARGEIEPATQSLAGVELVRGSPSLAQPGRFFEDGRSYDLVLSLKRISPDYRKVYSEPVRLLFRYRNVATGYAERLVTPLGTQLGAGASRELMRARRYDRLVP